MNTASCIAVTISRSIEPLTSYISHEPETRLNQYIYRYEQLSIAYMVHRAMHRMLQCLATAKL